MLGFHPIAAMPIGTGPVFVYVPAGSTAYDYIITFRRHARR